MAVDDTFLTEPPPGVREELERSIVSYPVLVREAMSYLEDPDVDDMALARMFVERGYSDELANWIVREAEVRRAPEADRR
jgi:hypothetical protein